MPLRAEYIRAIEQRLAWLRWAQGEGRAELTASGFGPAIPIYANILRRGDTFYMSSHFARLVEHARRSVPGELRFERTWLQADAGWIWLDDPFEVPPIVAVPEQMPPGFVPTVRAVGWQALSAGEDIHLFPGGHRVLGKSLPGSVQFACFENMATGPGFGAWSYFVLRDGERLDERITHFERIASEAQEGGAYQLHDRTAEGLHEIRWIYTALYLMAQRLAVTVKHDTDRHTRRRAEREGQEAPPFIKVITLRRLEAARQREAPAAVDWQWQWEVRGHWRNQFYPSEGVHKSKFIEAYIKGPADKPLKPGTIKLFTARR